MYKIVFVLEQIEQDYFFEVHTTDNPSGPYRDIVLEKKKNNTKWKVLNEWI